MSLLWSLLLFRPQLQVLWSFKASQAQGFCTPLLHSFFLAYIIYYKNTYKYTYIHELQRRKASSILFLSRIKRLIHCWNGLWGHDPRDLEALRLLQSDSPLIAKPRHNPIKKQKESAWSSTLPLTSRITSVNLLGRFACWIGGLARDWQTRRSFRFSITVQASTVPRNTAPLTAREPCVRGFYQSLFRCCIRGSTVHWGWQWCTLRLCKKREGPCYVLEYRISFIAIWYLGLPTPKRYQSFCTIRRFTKFMVVSSVSPKS